MRIALEISPAQLRDHASDLVRLKGHLSQWSEAVAIARHAITHHPNDARLHLDAATALHMRANSWAAPSVLRAESVAHLAEACP